MHFRLEGLRTARDGACIIASPDSETLMRAPNTFLSLTLVSPACMMGGQEGEDARPTSEQRLDAGAEGEGEGEGAESREGAESERADQCNEIEP